MGPIMHHRNPQWAFLRLSRLGDIYPTYRLRFLLIPVLWVQTLGQSCPLFSGDGFDPIDACGVLALIVLGHPANGQQVGGMGLHQQFLEFVDRSLVATLFGSKDALLDAVDMLLELAPGQLVPTLTLRSRLLPFPGCLRISHLLAPLSSLSSCLRQRIRRLSRRR